MHDSFSFPRPEYPRPDRQRGTCEGVDWLNLNGAWQFRFDGDNRGLGEQWFDASQPEWLGQIIVPFCWESLAAWGEGAAAGNDNYYSTRVFREPLEVNRSNHRSAPRYEIGWYRRRVEIPQGDGWKDKRVILTVGAADFFTDCWCNGVHVGRHEGGYTPMEFDITDALIEKSTPEYGRTFAEITLRVEDPMDNAEQPVGKQWQWYTTTSGIWQTVWIEPRNAAHIDNFRITTDIDTPSVTFHFDCIQSNDCEVGVEATAPDGTILRATCVVKDNIADGEIAVPNPFLWDPNHPHLYRVRLTLRRAENELDAVKTYFGMRKIDAAPMPDGTVALRLNSVARYLRGALYQAYFADGVYTANDLSVLRDDIAYAQKVGFNFLRVHIKVDDPLLLYLADTMGMLLMCDFPNFGEGGDTPLGRARFENTMRGAIKRDFNHPSIIAWCLFNETWGFGGQVELVKWFPKLEPSAADVQLEPDVQLQQPAAAVSATETEPVEPIVESGERKLQNRGSHKWVEEIWRLAKSLDPTRLVEDMSVVHWEHLDYYQHGDTDINSWHFYIDDYDRAKTHIEKIAADTFAGSTFNYLEGYEQKSQPLINSEYGGIGALDGNRDASWSFKFLTSELRRQGKIAAYIYTELHDVEWEHNGFLNYDRTPKELGYDPLIINSADVLPIDAAPISRKSPGESVEISVSSSHYSTKKRESVSLQWRLSGMDSLGAILGELGRGSTPIEFPHRSVAIAQTLKLQMPDARCLCRLEVTAVSGGQTLARNFIQFLVSPDYPPMCEDFDGGVVLRAAPADWDFAEWSDGQCERENARAEDACWGRGHGFFEWTLPLDGADISRARRISVVCEASSRRETTQQTDVHQQPTTMQILLNGLRVRQAKVPNHPHDARGALSYLRGGKGAYGYLAHAVIEGELLHDIAERARDGYIRLRCAVPETTSTRGGLTLYGAECGRFPIAPTVIIEW